MRLPESRISGNVYDKCDKSRWMQALDFSEIQKTTYFDKDEVVYVNDEYFKDAHAEDCDDWSKIFE